MPEESKLKQRTLAKVVKNVSETFPVLLITGPRQVGKTTLLRYLAKKQKKKITYISLDDPQTCLSAKKEPKLFLERNSCPLLIDEIQYAPELLPLIKMKVDDNGKTGMFWITGSQQFHLMKGVSESLAGRVGILNLQGFSQSEKIGNPNVDIFLPTENSLKKRSEYCHKINLMDLYSQIWLGSFPNIFLKEKMDWSRFYGSYVQTYIKRDVRDLTKVGDEEAFMRFLQAVAARTGQLLNYAELAKDVGIMQTTAKSWISILQTSGLVYLLQPYYTNITKRLIKTPKLYFLDTGLCAYLTRWNDFKTLEAGAMSGAILETYIVSELLKTYWHNGQEAPFYFYRDQDSKEIDLLIHRDGKLYPIEIKKSAHPDENDIRHFSTLNRLNLPIGHGAVICLCDRITPISKSVDAVPVGCI